MREPLISIIIPVFNVERYLERCVRSVQDQTYRNLEIILVDDGSVDRSGKICDEFAQGDTRICVIHKSNGGLSSARNAGLAIMRGEYVGFVDSDDWVAPEMYECLYQRIGTEGAQVSCCGIALCDDEAIRGYLNPDLSDCETMEAKEALRYLTYNKRITNSVNDKLYISDIFNNCRFREGILYEDAQIQPSCIARASIVTYTAKPMYFYYQGGTSILRSSYSPRRYDMIRWSEERIEFYKNDYPELVEYAYAAHMVLITHIAYQSRNCSESYAQTNQLICFLRSNMTKNIFSKLDCGDRIRCGLLYCNRRLFYAVLNLIYKAREINQKNNG